MQLRQKLYALVAIGSIFGGTVAMAADDKGNAMAASVANANNQFALDLYAKLRQNPGNIIESPYSIASALAMTYQAARGQTAAQMKECLHLPDGDVGSGFAALDQSLQSDKGYELNIANALWGQKGYQFMDAFTTTLTKQYGAGLHDADFLHATDDARKTINTWVEDQTKDKIKGLLKPGVLTSQTRLVLVNAIYFKGKWATQFKKEQTQEAQFSVLDDTTPDRQPTAPVKVQMMHQTAQFSYMRGDGISALELPYVGHDTAMVVLLPDVEGKSLIEQTAALGAMEANITDQNLAKWIGQMHKQKVEVFLPRFTATAEFQLASILQQMGMTDAFSPKLADFSGMTDKRDLSISDVIHKAFVDVNEEGTEAAAATAVGLQTMAIMQTPIFRADHSFVFLIRDTRSDAILFMGRMLNPAH